MEKVTSTNQLNRGQKVIVIDQTKGFTANVYRFVSEDISIDTPEIKEHYGYFVDIADQPVRLYMHEKRGMPIFKNYTQKEILICEKKYYEDELAEIKTELSNMNKKKKQNHECKN